MTNTLIKGLVNLYGENDFILTGGVREATRKHEHRSWEEEEKSSDTCCFLHPGLQPLLAHFSFGLAMSSTWDYTACLTTQETYVHACWDRTSSESVARVLAKQGQGQRKGEGSSYEASCGSKLDK